MQVGWSTALFGASVPSEPVSCPDDVTPAQAVHRDSIGHDRSAAGKICFWITAGGIQLPIFLPIIKSPGYDPVWCGILFNINMQIAYLSPPFGGACFFLKSVAPPDVTMEEIFASCWPWMGLQLIALILVMVFPEIALWLPRVAG